MNLGILLWNTCNAKCEHCAVSSSPQDRPAMTDAEVFSLIELAFDGDPKPSIGFSGGEAFLFFDRLCAFIDRVTQRGGSASVNTNGFWGITPQAAERKVARLLELGLSQLVVSMDNFHDPWIPVNRPLNVVRACKDFSLHVEVQYVATKKTQRLSEFVDSHSDVLAGVECREIHCHPVGRAAVTVPAEDLITEPGIPRGRCPSSVMSVSAEGAIIPCCNTAGHLPAMELGHLGREDLDAARTRFDYDPVLTVLRVEGPAAFYDDAVAAGMTPSAVGYVDQCHLCYELFKGDDVASQLHEVAQERVVDVEIKRVRREFELHLEDAGTSAGID